MAHPDVIDGAPEGSPEPDQFGLLHWGIQVAVPLLLAGVLVASGWALSMVLRTIEADEVMTALGHLSSGRFALALLVSLAGYAVLAGYDGIALAAIGKRIAFRRVLLSSFIAYAMSQTLGFPLLTGGAVRYRFLTVWGLTRSESASVIGYAVGAFTVGLIGISGLALILQPAGSAAPIGLPILSFRLLGGLCLAVVTAYLGWAALRRTPLRWRGWEFPVPSLRLALAQLVVAGADWCLAALALFVLLPAAPGLTFLVLMGAFLIAQFAGMVSHVPGGLGVFEGLMVLFLQPYLDAPAVLGALLAFRVTYYLIPFSLGALLLLGSEGVRHRVRLTALVRRTSWIVRQLTGRWIPALMPYLLGGTAFVTGVILLVSSTNPAAPDRIPWLHDVLPAGVTAVSEFLVNLAGGGLVVLGWALSRRLDAAYRLTQVVLGTGLLASLSRGFEWGEILTLSTAFLLLLPARRVFDRRAAIAAEPFTPGWAAAICGVMAVTIWLGASEGSRSLRGVAGLGVALAVFGFARMLRLAPAATDRPSHDDLTRAATISREGRRGAANLALLGDKSLRFSVSGRGYLMFAVRGRSWVAMGDPVGPPDEQRELAWRFRAEADRHGGRIVFYEVGGENLSLYIDLGLTLHKLGEEAIVPLEAFSLEGSNRRGLRRIQRDVLKAGASFAIVPAEEVGAMLPEMRRISDQWLAEKETREKGFSLGRFDEEYLQRFPVATVRVGPSLVAFANLWAAPAGGELAIDIMRYGSDAPRGVMTYLFIELMLWGRARGYTTFNLGMAPLSGLENRALAPLWNKAGALLFRHGQHFYNFEGLREYKSRFDPVWRPRYLASPAGLALPRVLANVVTLVSGGLTGVLSR